VGTDYQLSNARYFLASLPFYCFLSASGFHRVVEFLVRRLRATAWNLSESAAHLVAPMALASLAALPARGVLRDTTADQEYRFLQRSLRSVPEGCTLVTIDPWNDRGLRPPFSLARQSVAIRSGGSNTTPPIVARSPGRSSARLCICPPT